ncbi:unnamed protein product [Trichogramma brassicae]|uniref:Glucose-methanol-choline oxidoreductase N-terminal domain-containing protein n=1 Tax=Trichogramma brassicae TaxID=86971 RepID=A0A6H5J203_9HYME|nr:unnamed protein product [Trichogramma brassicae]
MNECLSTSCHSSASGSDNVSVFLLLIRSLLMAQCELTNNQNYPPDRTAEAMEKANGFFDFIIVGGGSSGSVLARRLSDIGDWNILLIERGTDPSINSDLPALLLLLQSTEEDYNYKVKPNDRYCQGMRHKQCIWAKGKALGGSSSINAMLHVTGTDRDYDLWAAIGNKGWAYKDVRPYLRKIENYHPDIVAKYGDEFYGTGGPLTLRSYNYSESGLHDILSSAVKDLDWPYMELLNGGKYVGYGKVYGTIDRGVRQNVARAYLTPIKDRKNLYVIKSAQVTSLLMKKNKAIGVRVTLKDGRKVKFESKKEVILSAGSIATPQILMLSGIGPKEELKAQNIRVVADLPVGKNLQDHVIWLGVYLTYVNKTAPQVSPHILQDWAYEFLTRRSGEFATAGGVDLLGFINTKDPAAKYPNIEFHHSLMPRNQPFKANAFSKAFNFDDNLTDELNRINQESDIIMVCPVLLNPKSVGKLKLQTSKVNDHVEIHANYFDKREDIDVMLESLNSVRALLNTTTFKKLGIKLRPLNIPKCAKYNTESNEYWECNLRHTSASVYHPVGTCKMGPADDKTAVVDSSLKVHGIQNLRVIDASIMPIITSGNTHAPTLMIAEKGASLIKEEWHIKDEL